MHGNIVCGHTLLQVLRSIGDNEWQVELRKLHSCDSRSKAF